MIWAGMIPRVPPPSMDKILNDMMELSCLINKLVY
jgi:hypothetical protein